MIEVEEKSMLVTETDRRGVIRYINEDFCRLTGYAESELLGKPQSIMRHPDMPAEAFADLWNTIQSGEVWKGFLKNRAKNGDFYWVFATIFPVASVNGEGYLAVRVRAFDDEIERSEKRYEEMLKKERA